MGYFPRPKIKIKRPYNCPTKLKKVEPDSSEASTVDSTEVLDE